MQTRVTIALILLLAACATKRVAEQPGHYEMLDPDRFRLESSLDPLAVIIDIRSADDYREAHIERAVNMPDSASLIDYAATLPHRPPVYIYCDEIDRSITVAGILHRRGFTSLYILDGGLIRWRSMNLPLVNYLPSCCLTMRAIYLPTISNSRLTTVPFLNSWKLVISQV